MEAVETAFNHSPSVYRRDVQTPALHEIRAWPVQYHDTVRLLLLTARPDLEVNRRLASSATALGAEPLTVDASSTVPGLGGAPSLWQDGRDLLDPRPAAVLARVGNWRPDTVLAALEVAVACGVATPNPPGAIRVGRDHWRTLYRLAGAGLPVPPTVAGCAAEELADRAHAAFGLPVVVKLRRSRMGVGAIRCDRRDHLEAVLDSMWRLGEEVVVQAWVECTGRSLRLLVVGGRVVAAAALRAAPGEWRSNAARGGSMAAHGVRSNDEALAVNAARTLGLGVCGVDLLPGRETVVVEVNPTPGFLHLEEATGVDVAGAMVRHALLGADGPPSRGSAS